MATVVESLTQAAANAHLTYATVLQKCVGRAILPNTAKRLDSLHHWVSFAVLPVVETLRLGNEQGRGQISLGGEGRRLCLRGSRD